MSRFLLLMLAGCSCGDPPLDTVVDPPALVGEGLFEAGCPQAGRAIARVIDSQDPVSYTHLRAHET